MTNNKQQTAVEWFANESWQLKVQLDNQEISVDEYAVAYVILLYKAKEMDKQRIIDAIITHEKEHYVHSTVYPPQFVIDRAEQYYNETYGDNNE